MSAISIEVPSFEAKIDDKGDEYIVYIVSCSKDGRKWRSSKRYSELLTMHNKIKTLGPCGSIRFPEKKIFRTLSFLEKRKIDLERYLMAVFTKLSPEQTHQAEQFLSPSGEDATSVAPVSTQSALQSGMHMHKQPGRLAQHVAIVTGSKQGIGRAIAERLLADGARVMLSDIVEPDDIESLEGLPWGFTIADVRVEADMAKLFAETKKKFGKECTLLVNNAGIVHIKPFAELEVSEWDNMVDVHLRGCFLGCREFFSQDSIKNNQTEDKVIVNIASQLGQKGSNLGVAHYCSAKAGIIGLTKTLAIECGAKYKVRVNAIAPGPILTPMVRGLGKDFIDSKSKELPLPRFGEPEEAAAAVAFLASDDAKLFVGQTLGPNSGDVML